ncbi:MAG: hypothetical protein WD872_21565 [Pirellulaceae bacterium]
MFWRCLLISLACGLSGLAQDRLAQGQPPASPPATQAGETDPADPAAREAGPPAVEASSLDTYLLRDGKGNLVPVLDLPFEEFERLLRIKRGLAPPLPPAYSLDALSVTGTVEKGIADLQVSATIRVRDAGWVRVPLEFGKAILRQPARYEGPGEHLLAHEASGGYIAWLQGTDAKPHVVSLQVSVPVAQEGGGRRLALNFPTGNESSLRLVVPDARAEGTIVGGEGIVSSSPKGEGRSELTVLGPSGELQLAWQKGREPAAPGPSPLESTGEILVKIEGENRISSDARLRIRSFAGTLESFRVRLPPGMELIPTPTAGYAVSVVSPSTPRPNQGGAATQVVEVKFDRPAAGIAEVRILTALAAAAVGSTQFEPARFEVLGAVRQRGTIDFVTEGEWLLQWKEDGAARRLDIPPDPASARLVARYEYTRQPCRLQMSVSTRPSRIGVEPTHVLYVEARQVRLESTLKYRLRGARTEKLAFDLGQWHLDRLSPSDLFEIVPPEEDRGGLHEIPFRAGATIPSELELKLEAHLPLDAAQESLSFTIPRPLGDVVTPATVMVVPADNVELTPQSQNIVGLSLDPSPVTVRIPSRQQPPLIYRELNSDQPATFAADRRVRTQWTTVGARAAITLEKQQVQVEQRLDYRIAYEPRRSFELLVPRGVLLAGTLQVWQGAELLTPTPVADAPAPADTSRFQIQTSVEQIGLCQLVVKYAIPLPKYDRQKQNILTLPLVVPADELHQQVGGQQVEFASSEGWQLEPDPSGSDEFSRATPIAGQKQAYSWSRATPTSRWTLSPSEAGSAANVAVSKVWIQTWLHAGVRQDRAVFRLTTDQDQIRVSLPRAPLAGSVQAAVNGQSAVAVPREPAALVVFLPHPARGQECVVEVWYSLEEDLSAAGGLTSALRPAALHEASPPRRLFWQLCLPEKQHLVVAPDDLVAEMTWRTRQWFAGRQPVLRQEELESWIGASRQDPLPRGMNEYLYSSLGQSPTLRFVSAGRRELLAIGSGIVLAIGLLLIHVRWARRPEVLLAIGVATGAVALALPEAALLFSQAAVLGLAVALAAAAWLWLSGGRLAWGTPARQAPAALPLEVRSTEAPVARLERTPSLTTATAPAVGVAAETQP